jgi:SAM-dependent methyltransferase
MKSEKKILDLLVVLQTHSVSNRDNSSKRFVSNSKPEVTKRCVSSLVNTLIDAYNVLPNFNLRLKIFDDHSDEETLDFLNKQLSKCSFESSLEHLETRGVMPSILKCYEYGKDNGIDLVYFAQDDYLYEKSAVRDMVWTLMQTSGSLQSPVSVFPYNDPYHYAPVNTVISSHIIQSCDRHWRTNLLTASCFMTHVSIINKEWDLFYKMGTSDPFDRNMEDNSINQLFKERGYFLLIPIPSLAFHMQTESEKDPFADWQSLWNKHQQKPFNYQLEDKEKYFFNIGCGRSSIQDTNHAEEFLGMKEVRVDIDEAISPDVVADLLDLTNIPSDIADKVFIHHCLEHVDPYSVKQCIKQMHRILKPAGELIIVVPDLKVTARHILEGTLNDTLYSSPAGDITSHDMIYGFSKFIAKDNDFMRHRTGFTKETMTKVLEDLNYSFKVQEDNNNVVARIIK